MCTSASARSQHLATFDSPLLLAYFLLTRGPMRHLAIVDIVHTEFDFRFYIAGGCQERTTAVRITAWVAPEQWPALMTGELCLPRLRLCFLAGKRHRTGGHAAVVGTFVREWRVAGTLLVTAAAAAEDSSSSGWRYTLAAGVPLAALQQVLPLLDVDGSPLELPADTLAAMDSAFRPEWRRTALACFHTSPSLPAVLNYI